jgi:hypothetical protein
MRPGAQPNCGDPNVSGASRAGARQDFSASGVSLAQTRPIGRRDRGRLRGRTDWVNLLLTGWVGADRALHMRRLCLVGVGLLCSVAAAKAEDPTVPHSKLVRAHAVKATAASNGGALAGVNFSDPYAPPVGAQKAPTPRFPTLRTEAAAEPQGGGFSLTAGRDSPDAPFTGGLKFRF